MKRAILTLLICLLLFAFLSPIPSTKAEEDSRPLPILMYHSLSETQRGVYSLSPEVLRADLAAIKARGYVFVPLSAVVKYLKGEGDLPEKPILLTFDDGHYNNLYYGLDVLREYDAYAVLNVIGCFSEYSSTHEKDHVEYSHLTWDEIAYLARSGVFEIGSHTYAMHAYKPRFGIKRMKGESIEEHRRALSADLERIDRALLDKCGVRPVAFAYPFGAYDKSAEKVVKERYEAIFTCYERVNRLTKGDREKLSYLWRINRDGTKGTNDFLDEHGIL